MMQKIPTVFRRDPQDMARLLAEVNPGCEWVLAGEGLATRKHDGTCVMLDGSGWWARREVKADKVPPVNYRPVETDPVTGKTVGWEPVAQSAFAKAFVDAFEHDPRHAGIGGGYLEGTYELVGPKVNANPERIVGHHVLIRHQAADVLDYTDRSPRTFETIRDLVVRLAEDEGWEGIVYRHPDGRMAKIKARDFRLSSLA